MRTIHPLLNARRVYCAGPLFNAAERQEMAAIADVLQRRGFETFVPHADGFEFANVLPYLVDQGCEPTLAGQFLHAAIFAMDVYQVLVGCGSLVFNLNGRTPDEGGVAEMTMAWMAGKPVIIYKDDVRSAIAGRDNPLVIGQANFLTVRTLDSLPLALSQSIAASESGRHWEFVCPAHLEQHLNAGETFWNRLQALDGERPGDVLGGWVLDLFGQTQPLAQN